MVDVISALVVFVGINLMHFSTAGFAVTHLCLATIWIGLAIALGREYVKVSGDNQNTLTTDTEGGASK